MAFKIHMGGKRVGFANFDAESQKGIMENLAKKDNLMDYARKTGIHPGVKIDGKPVDQAFLDSIDLDKGAKVAKLKAEPKKIIDEIIEPKKTKKKSKKVKK